MAEAKLSRHDQILLRMLIDAIREEDEEELQICLKNGTHLISYLAEDGLGLIHHAVIQENLRILDLLIKLKGAQIDQRDQFQNSPLHLSCRNENVEILKFLVAHKHPLDLTNQEGRTPLHIAVLSNNRSAVNALIKFGANLNVQDKDQLCALHSVAQSGHKEIISLLCSSSELNPDLHQNSMTSLHMASEKGHLHCVKELIKCKAKLTKTDAPQGWFPIHFAAFAGHTKLVVAFIEKFQVPVDITTHLGSTALYLCVCSAHISTMLYLVESAKAQLDLANTDGFTALHKAALDGKDEMLMLLIKHGADYNRVKPTDGYTPLHCASMNNHAICIQALVSKGADMNAVTKEGRTALHIAAIKGHCEAVQMLCFLGADLDFKTEKGSTAENLALDHEQTKVFQIIQKHRTDKLSLTNSILEKLSNEILELKVSVKALNRKNDDLTLQNNKLNNQRKLMKSKITALPTPEEPPHPENESSHFSSLNSEKDSKFERNLDILKGELEAGNLKKLYPYLKDISEQTDKQVEKRKKEISYQDYSTQLLEIIANTLKKCAEEEQNPNAESNLRMLREKEKRLIEENEILKQNSQQLEKQRDSARRFKERLQKMGECLSCQRAEPLFVYKCGHMYCSEHCERGKLAVCPACSLPETPLQIAVYPPNATTNTKTLSDDAIMKIITAECKLLEAAPLQ